MERRLNETRIYTGSSPRLCASAAKIFFLSYAVGVRLKVGEAETRVKIERLEQKRRRVPALSPRG
jgi:hypothetical protein